MKFVFFYHSLVSDWNHGNAHFLRGVAAELLARGHDVEVYEPADGWSLKHLLDEQGPEALLEFHRVSRGLRSRFYIPSTLDVERALHEADVVLVHEWNPPDLVGRIGRAAVTTGVRAFFHDTHHRTVTDEGRMARMPLRDYTGVLAFGAVLRDAYLVRGWSERAWTWHEAADMRLFHPRQGVQLDGDLVWIGNWGDDERTRELQEYLVTPVARLGLTALVHGVRYPAGAVAMLEHARIRYAGWVPNHRVPEVFARYKFTVHVPRRAYVDALRGIPTIRMFEALACGIPLVSAPWQDTEQLFRAGVDYLVARNGAEMEQHLRALREDAQLRAGLAANGLATIRSRHTCAHRVDELLGILEKIGSRRPHPPRAAGLECT